MTVLAAFAGLFVLLVGILSLPLTFCSRIRLAQTLVGEVELAWAWGVVGARVDIAGRRPTLFLRFGTMAWIPLGGGRKDKSTDGRTAKDEEKEGSTRPLRKWSEIYGSGEVMKRGVAYVRRVTRSLRLRLRVTGEYGTGDPALTGYLTALMAAVGGGSLDLDMVPDYSETRMDLQGELRGGMIPLRFLWQTSGFLLARPIRRIWWRQIGKRKSKFQEG